MIVYAVSFCSPLDKFDKNAGRTIAKRRISEVTTPASQNGGVVVVSSCASYHEIKGKIVADMYAKGNFPSHCASEILAMLYDASNELLQESYK